MALRLARPDDIAIPVADPRRSFDVRSPIPVSALATAVGVVGRGLAIAVGLGVLLVAGPGPASLTVIAVLAIGSALLSWDQ